MKLVFICGSLELGRDGVGDYVRRLAIELQKQGHEIVCIAIKDSYVTQEESNTSDSSIDKTIIIRFPYLWTEKLRFNRAQYYINHFNPEWLSLQFVPFSFNSKGMLLGFSSMLASLGKGRHWHLMIHELWVGMNQEATFVHKVWGQLQRFLIKRLISHINPAIIHTQSLLYQLQLVGLGYDSFYLPLFSNIPRYMQSNSHDSLPAESNSFQETKNIYLVVFGSIHPGAPIVELAHDALLYSRENGKVISLVMIGRCGNELKHWTEVWAQVGLPMQILGEQPPEVISRILTEASLGVSTTPAALIGKSGTVAAMLEHGLPVLSVSQPWRTGKLSALKIPEWVYVYSPGNFAKYLKPKPSVAPINNVSNIAQQLASSLLIASNSKQKD